MSVAAWPRHAGATGAAPTGTLSATLGGKVVRFGFSGLEPDFDPIDRVVIAGTLRDTHTGTGALPDMMVVLSAYLENFQPDTTPVLPDLLHPDQVATSLGGFMQGKAALVNAAGQVGYRGSLLAEVFLDNSVHLVLDLHRVGAPATAPALRLLGIIALYKDLAVSGHLRTARPLTPRDVGMLRVPRGRPVTWQAVVSGLTVRLPPMMGTAGAAGTAGTAGTAGAARPARSGGSAHSRRVPVAMPSQPRPGTLSARTIALMMALAAALLALVAGWLTVAEKRRRVKPDQASAARPVGDVPGGDAAHDASSS